MRDGSTQAQIGVSLKNSKLVPNWSQPKYALSKLLIGKVIDLHSKYHDAVRRKAAIRERFSKIWRR